MRVFLLILISEVFGRMVDVSDIHSSQLVLLFQKLGKPLLQQLLLILMLGDQLLKALNLGIMLLYIPLVLLHLPRLLLHVAVVDLKDVCLGRLLLGQL